MTPFGGAVLALIGLAVLAPVGAVAALADWPPRLEAGDAAAIRFTVWQAGLSALISVALAVPLARALARRTFPGRGVLVALLGAPFILPAIVAVMGVLAVWGRSGWISDGLGLFGLGPVDIYGLWGVVLAHVFFNMPLATRMVLLGWATVPAAHVRLAAQLGAGRWARFRLLEAPVLRATVPGAFLLIFLLCTASFAVVLALGGGPRATSVELAIFTALRFDFDPGRAALLALVQLALGGGAALVLLAVSGTVRFGGGDLAPVAALGHGHRGWDAAVIGLAALFVITPLAGVVVRGATGAAAMVAPGTLAALWVSLQIAALATVVTVCLALPVAGFIARRGRRLEAIAVVPLVVSPFVLGAGLFLIIRAVADPFALAVPLTAGVNALLSLPFAVRVLVPAIQRVDRLYGPLAANLAMSGGDRFRLLVWPGLRRPLGFAAGLAAALAMGDLGVIALFAPVDAPSLPMHMYRLMGAYRMTDAAAVGLLLVAVSLALFLILDRGGRLGRAL